MMRIALPLGAALLLAACGDPPAERAAPAASPSPTVATEPPRPSPSPVPDPTPSPTAAATGTLSAIPEAWHGVWSGEGATCAASSPVRLRIAADRLVFYEAEATPTGIERVSEREVRVDLSFAGEGETWTRRNVLALGDDGDTLLRSEPGAAATRYTRCPAGTR